jgi:uncharacterized protein YjbI with pentapeptide repeats
MDLKYTVLMQADLSYANISNSELSSDSVDLYAYLIDTDIRYTDFTESVLVGIDFTKIKNKSLAGANLYDTSFAWSNLSGVSLDGATLHGNNFYKTNLSGQDFTIISNMKLIGSVFREADLSNSNFKGVSLAEDKAYVLLGKNQAHLADKPLPELIKQLTGLNPQPNKIYIKEIIGNDLKITIILYNNFSAAKLQNANFSNADLTNARFLNADLTNAILYNANLKNALLDGAILDGAVLDCKNHSICE